MGSGGTIPADPGPICRCSGSLPKRAAADDAPCLARAYAELAAACASWGVTLSPTQEELIDRYIADVLAYNVKTNLTAMPIRKSSPAACSPTACRSPPVAGEIDGERSAYRGFGSGGDSSAWRLKIAWPQAEVTLMESLERRYRFLTPRPRAPGSRAAVVLKAPTAQSPDSRYEKDFDAVVSARWHSARQALALALLWPRPMDASSLSPTHAPNPDDAALKKRWRPCPAEIAKVDFLIVCRASGRTAAWRCSRDGGVKKEIPYADAQSIFYALRPDPHPLAIYFSEPGPAPPSSRSRRWPPRC